MRDAQLLDHYPPGTERAEAKHPWVWVRRKGAWRKGAIHCWYIHGDTWMAWLQHEPVDDVPWADWGLFRYDGKTIRRRHHPPARVHIELPAAGAASEMRELGYAVMPEQDVLVLG